MKTKSIYKSKTLYFNILTIALGCFLVVNNTYPVPADILALVVGLGNVILRFLSSKKITI